MGNAFKEQGRLNEAINAYKDAIKRAPSHVEAHYNLGNAFKEQGRLNEAIDAYKDAIKRAPSHVEAHYNLGNAFKEQGRLNEAINAYKDAIKENPAYVEVYNNLGVALKDVGEMRAAINAFESALSIKADYTDVWSNGAEVLEKWNKLEELDEWLKRADQAFESAPPDIKYMQAKSLWRQKEFEKAKRIIFNLELDGITYIWKQDFLNLRAKCYEKIHDFDNAYNSILLMNSYTKEVRSMSFLSRKIF